MIQFERGNPEKLSGTVLIKQEIYDQYPINWIYLWGTVHSKGLNTIPLSKKELTKQKRFLMEQEQLQRYNLFNASEREDIPTIPLRRNFHKYVETREEPRKKTKGLDVILMPEVITKGLAKTLLSKEMEQYFAMWNNQNIDHYEIAYLETEMLMLPVRKDNSDLKRDEHITPQIEYVKSLAYDLNGSFATRELARRKFNIFSRVPNLRMPIHQIKEAVSFEDISLIESWAEVIVLYLNGKKQMARDKIKEIQ